MKLTIDGKPVNPYARSFIDRLSVEELRDLADQISSEEAEEERKLLQIAMEMELMKDAE